MTTAESLELLREKARDDKKLARVLLSTRKCIDPLKEFCRISTENGCPLSSFDVVMYGEESCAATRRSTNGGGENHSMLAWEDDYYELFMAELESVRG